MLEIQMLGAFTIKRRGRTVALTSRPAQSLFAYLVLNAGVSHRREKLAGQLWPDSREEAARDYLRHALWRIRKALSTVSAEGYLKADDLSVTFVVSEDCVLDTVTVSHAGDRNSAEELMESLSAYQGELLPGFYDEWVVLEREHLRAVYEQEMDRLLGMLEQEWRWGEMLEWAEKWIAFGQKPEPAYRGLMLAHAANGDMSKVALSYERLVKTLREFGVEPAEQTRTLYEQIKAGKHTAAKPRAAVAPVQKATSVSNIPVPLTSFVGRERELKKILELIESSRLVTLTGPGGVGKTRLAIQAASMMRGKFKDGICWVDLGPIADPALVSQTIAQSLDVHSAPNEDLTAAIRETVGARKLLLVVDNCEHLITTCAELAELLLGSCPNLRILATSRESLGIFGETPWAVPPLGVPGSDLSDVQELTSYESIRLFIERVRDIAPDFVLGGGRAEAITRICRRLDGIPLALELAAARVKMLTVEEIAARLDQRFSLLAAGSRTAAERHQTLRATLDWSHELLSDVERILFRRLSVFSGGFSASAAESLTAGNGLDSSEVLGVLGNLINKSLVAVQERSADADWETRYVLLESIREYASDKLRGAGEDADLREKHLRYFLNIAERIQPELERSRQRYWLDRLELDIDNFRAACSWALKDGKLEEGLRLASSLRRLWFVQYHVEGVERLRALLAAPADDRSTPGRLRALNALLFMGWPSGEVEAAEGRPLIEEALNLARELEDNWNLAFSLLWAGVNATTRGDYAQARSYLEQSLGLWNEIDDATYVASAKIFLGELELYLNNASAARSLFEASIPPLRGAADLPVLAIPLRRLGQLALLDGDPETARPLITESLRCNWDVRDFRGVAACLAALGSASLVEADAGRAVKFFGMADRVVEAIRTPLLLFDRLEYNRNVELARARLRQGEFAASWETGRATPLGQAIAYAFEPAARGTRRQENA